jgi:predicted SprT family Zn-dependent metalloprotease
VSVPKMDPIKIREVFIYFNIQYFEGLLPVDLPITWSNRMTLTAGKFMVLKPGKPMEIRLSYTLLKLRTREDVIDTLVHEMIHAFLWITKGNDDRKLHPDGHGPAFKGHMKRINHKEGTKMSIYHYFYKEVEYYRQQRKAKKAKSQAEAEAEG